MFTLANTFESPLLLLPELKKQIRSRVKTCPFQAILRTWKQAEMLVNARTSKEDGLGQVLSWIANFVAKPNASLGRQGAVCPFLPRALKSDSLFFHELKLDTKLGDDQIDELIKTFADVFANTLPNVGKSRLNKAIVLVFPNLTDELAVKLIEETQHRLKPFFVGRGLMLGEFHENHQGEGIRNDKFRPLQSPVPLLVIRHLLPSDLLFLVRKSDSAARRVHFLQSFLNVLSSSLSEEIRKEASSALIEALSELEQVRQEIAI